MLPPQPRSCCSHRLCGGPCGVFGALCLCLLQLVEIPGAASLAPELLFTLCSWQPVQCSWCPVLVLADSCLRCRVLPLRPRFVGATRCLTALLATAVCSAISGDTWQPSHCVNAPPPQKKKSRSTWHKKTPHGPPQRTCEQQIRGRRGSTQVRNHQVTKQSTLRLL